MSIDSDELNATIAALPTEQRMTLKTLAEQLSDWLNKHGANAIVAFAVVALELQDRITDSHDDPTEHGGK